MDFDFSAAYTTGDGIAWRVDNYVTSRDEDYEWSGIENVDYDRVEAHMVGDDRTFTFDIDELTKIDEDEYCPECGQIGCKAYG